MLILWKTLEQGQWICKSDSQFRYYYARHYFNIIHDKSDIVAPAQLHHVFSIYTPLSVLLITQADKWDKMAKHATIFPFPTVQFSNNNQEPAASTNANNVSLSQRKIVLLVYLGGITYAEMNAIRLLNTEQCRYLVLTTGMLGKDALWLMDLLE